MKLYLHLTLSLLMPLTLGSVAEADGTDRSDTDTLPASKQQVPQKRETPIAEATIAETREIETLINALVLHKRDVEDRTYKEGVIERISSAAAKLGDLGKKSWPVLLRHLDDRRPSDAPAQIAGPYTVGLQCYYILRGQMVSYPKGYPRYRGSHADDLGDLFKPNLKEWLAQQMDKPLEQIQIESVEYVLKQEKADPKPDPQSIELLEKHLVVLQQRNGPKPITEEAEQPADGKPSVAPQPPR